MVDAGTGERPSSNTATGHPGIAARNAATDSPRQAASPTNENQIPAIILRGSFRGGAGLFRPDLYLDLVGVLDDLDTALFPVLLQGCIP